MAILPRPARLRAIRTNLNILPVDLRAPIPSLVDISLALVLFIGLLLLFTVFQVKARADAFQRNQQAELASTQAAITQLSSSEGVQLRNALQDAQSRLQGVVHDFEDIAAHKVRWSMAVRAVQSHPQVRVDEITQAPRSLSLTVKGLANNDAALMEYGNGLRNSGIFEDVRFISIGGAAVGGAPSAGPVLPVQPGPPVPAGNINPMGSQPVIPQPTPQPPIQVPAQATKPAVGQFIPPPIVPGGIGPSLAPDGTVPNGDEPPAGEVPVEATPAPLSEGTPTPAASPSLTASPLGTETGTVTPSASAAAGYEFTVASQQATYIPPERDSGVSMPGTISGKLIDAADQLVPGAVFRIESYGSPMWSAESPSAGQSASNGTFSFTSLRRATYRVYVVSGSSQAAVDLYVGADGTKGFNTWDVVFRKNTSGNYGYWGSMTPTATGSPMTETPTLTATPTATPTFAEPTPSPGHHSRELAIDITQQAIWWDCVCASGNEDWFKINVPTRGSRLSVTMGQGGSFGLFIVDPSGQAIVIQDLSASQTKTLNWDIGDNTGYWYVRVSAVTYGYYSNIPYFLSPLITQPTALPSATPLPTSTPLPGANCAIEQTNTSLDAAFWMYTSPVRGQICYPGDKAYFYKFLANPGATFEVRLTQPVPLTLSLYGYTGDLLGTAAYQATPRPLTLSRTAPAASTSGPSAYTYTVRVASASGAGSLDSWELFLINASAPTATVTRTPTLTATGTPSPPVTPTRTPTRSAGQIFAPDPASDVADKPETVRLGFSLSPWEPAGVADDLPPSQPTPAPPLPGGPVIFPTPPPGVTLPAPIPGAPPAAGAPPGSLPTATMVSGAVPALPAQPPGLGQPVPGSAPLPGAAPLVTSGRPVPFVMILSMRPAGAQ